MKRLLPPIHPGEVLKEEFMKRKRARARASGSGKPYLGHLNADRGVTADTALRLAKALGTTADFWLNLQKQYDLDCARDGAKDLGRIEPIRASG
jgi:antitoxin HigA-1